MSLFYREGQSTQQVARLLGLSDAAVRKRLQRTRRALRQDVMERFAEVARRTAPGAAFTAGILAAIAGAPVSTAAVLSTSASASTPWLGSKALTLLGGAGAGFLAGASGVTFGLSNDFKNALDDWERGQLRALRKVALLALLLAAVGISPWAMRIHWFVPVSSFAVLMLTYAALYMIWLPKLLHRRFMALEQGDEAKVRRRLRQRLRQVILGWSLGGLFGGLGLWAGLHAITRFNLS